VAETYPKPYAHYVLLERLGVGGMSEVDLARNRVDDGSFVRFAVIKRIKADYATDESFVRMFKDEARITSELHHENIGSVYDFGRVGDEYYLALEYVPGIDLRFLVNTLRDRGQRVPVKVALRVIVDVLGALSYAHDKKDTWGRAMGIVHRDVNPRNVMMSIRGEVKLIDFGVAKATDRLEQTRADHVKGKFAYMAPEQLTGTGVDHRSDLFAVGLVLHELIAGVSPYFGLNQVQILHRMLNASVPELPPIPELTDEGGLRRVHARALAADPDDRYATAAEFADDVRALAEQIGGLPTQDQLAGFLNAVDPELTLRLQGKMEQYAQIDVVETEVLPPPEVEAQGRAGPTSTSGSIQREPSLVVGGSHPSLSGTMARQMHYSLRAEPSSVARTGVLAGSVLLVSVLSALVAGAIVAVALIGAWFFLERQPSVPAPTLPPIGAVDAQGSAPAEAVDPAAADPAVDPAAAEPEPPEPKQSRPPRTRPRPSPAPVVLPAEAVEPEPVVEPAGADGPDLLTPDADLVDPFPALPSEPAPAPAPPSAVGAGDDVEYGYVNVTVAEDAPEGQVQVRIDGEAAGTAPLMRARLPIGPHSVDAPGRDCKPGTVNLVHKSQTVNVVCR
jgi:serine/threonine protein kinase